MGAFWGYIFFINSLRMNIADIFSDLQMGLNVQELEHRAIDVITRAFEGLPALLLVLVLCSLAIAYRAKLSCLRFLLLSAAFILAGLALAGSNLQPAEFTIWATGALILAEFIRRSPASGAIKISAQLMAYTILLSTSIRDFGSILTAAVYQRDDYKYWQQHHKFEAKPLRDWVVAEWQYVNYLNSGVKYLHKHQVPLDKLFLADYLNPFPFAAQKEPAKGDLLWWHFSRTFTDKFFPPAKELFKNKEFILVPQKSRESFARDMIENIYSDYLSRYYTQIDSNKDWRLLGKQTTR